MFDLIISLACLATTSLSGVPSCDASPELPGQSIVFEDDAGLIALSWDGEQATIYRDSIEHESYPAETWSAALWGMETPSYGTVSAPTTVDHAIDEIVMRDLIDCGWTASMRVQDCSL